MRQIKLAMLAFGRTLIYVVEIEIEIINKEETGAKCNGVTLSL